MRNLRNFIRDNSSLSIFCLSFLIAFILIFLSYLTGLVVSLDNWINSFLSSIRNVSLNNLMIFITNLGGEEVIVILSCILILFLLFKKRIYYSLLLVLSMLLGIGLENLIKLAVHRARPENIIVFENSFSFPSGHSIAAIIFFCFLFYAFASSIKNQFLRYLMILACICLFLSIGFSRLYLGAHWFSDVIGGFLLGGFALTFSMLFLKYFSKREID